MEIVPIIDQGLGNSSYVIDLGEGQGLVMDPERDPTPYLAEAQRRDLTLRWIAETHLHADFVSGAAELIAQGARLLAPAQSRLEFDHEAVEDEDEVYLGGLTLRVIGTPGHTPEHVAYLLADGPRLLALFSGGTLMAGGVARTDLITPELTEPLARSAYRSIRDELMTLPDSLAVYPTHGAGSFCSAPSTGQRTTTIGAERSTNPLLQAEDEDDFVRRLADGLGNFPTYFLRLRTVNRTGPRVYGRTAPVLAPLTVDQIGGLIADGGQIVDVRTIDRFGQGHLPGSISIELRDQFATWLGWVASPEQAIAVVIDDYQDVGKVVWEARNVGYENLVGYLDGGIGAWIASGQAVATIALVDPDQISPDATVVDVRQASERTTGHVPDSLHIELGEVGGDLAELDGASSIVIHCGHGQRAMTAASLISGRQPNSISVTTAGAEDIAARVTA